MKYTHIKFGGFLCLLSAASHFSAATAAPKRLYDTLNDTSERFLAMHKASDVLSDAEDSLLITLPDVGDVIFDKRWFQQVGKLMQEEALENVWIGDVHVDDQDGSDNLVQGTGTFVLQPDGSLFCTIKVRTELSCCCKSLLLSNDLRCVCGKLHVSGKSKTTSSCSCYRKHCRI
jgi:hypothetical protein